jgi:predicted alpha/beta hydrolase family esterase
VKNAIIFHGTGESPDDQWFPWVKQQMEKAGYTVSVPNLPQMNQQPIAEMVSQVLPTLDLNEETVLIGHSAGAPFILSILEVSGQKIARALLIAGFYTEIDMGREPVLQPHYDWQKLAPLADYYMINSTNDPWKCDDTQGRLAFDKLGGTLIIKQDGHFGSASHQQEYKTFPLVAAIAIGAYQ